MADIDPAGLEGWARGAEAPGPGPRHLIDPRGAVLADSQHDPETMENHNERPEVRQARQGLIGVATRHSATLDVDLSYVAMPVAYRGEPELRAAGWPCRCARSIRPSLAVRQRILGASVVAALLALAMAYWFSRSFTRRVRRLESFAQSLLGARVPESLAPDASR